LKRILFYATPTDIKDMLARFECIFPVEYIPFGPSAARTVSPYTNSSEIKNLGKADHDQTSACASYLVYPVGTKIIPVSFTQENGNTIYSWTQLNNEDTVVFRPAGLWTDGICIYGEISTIHDSFNSKRLMKIFQKQFSISFEKVKSFWLGREANEMLMSGKRLTMAVQSPLEYNLSAE
jgi:hypothetical protein